MSHGDEEVRRRGGAMTRGQARRPPYWTLPMFAVLMAAPAPVVYLVFAAAVALALARAVRRRAARSAAAAGAPAPGAVALGHDRSGAPFMLEARELAAHSLILGASGSGKSTTLLRMLTTRIEQGLPVLAIDLKGGPEFARALAQAAERAGRPFVLWSADGQTRWNPLAYGNPTELKDKLIATERFSEPHYQRAAERYLQTVFTVLATRDGSRAPALGEVADLCDPVRLGAAARRLPDPLRSRVQDYLGGLTPDQLSAVRGLGTRLALLTESHVGPLLTSAPTGPELDVRRVLEGQEVACFSLNSARYGKLAAQLGTLAVQDIIAASGHRLLVPEGERGQALVGVDEFSALGSDHLVGLLARGREAGIAVVLATQELADLDRAAHGARDQVVGNTATKIIHRQDVPASARLAAQMAGTEFVIEETRQFGAWSRQGMWPRGTRREVERFRVHPNEISSLRTGEALVITKAPRLRVAIVTVQPGPAVAPERTPAPAPAPARQERNQAALRSVRSPERPPAARPQRRSPPARGERAGPEL